MAKTKKSAKPERPVVSDTEDDTCGADRVWVCLAKTVNLGNYESLKVEVGRGSSVQPGETHDEVQERITANVAESLFELLSQVQKSL